MGSTRLRYTSQSDTHYTAYYWDLRSQQLSAGTFTRTCDAERAWRCAEAQIADGKFVNLATGRQRFARYVTESGCPKTSWNSTRAGATNRSPGNTCWRSSGR